MRERRYQSSARTVIALFVCSLINVLDGFDILSVSFIASRLSEDWVLPPELVGLILSAGLFGMMVGAMALGPIADRIGRKPCTIISLVIASLGMFWASAVTDAETLIAARIATGIGIGGILASLNTFVAELTSSRLRGLAVSAFHIGYPLGGVIGGTIAAWLLVHGTWRSIFLFGAIATLMMIPLAWLALPKPIRADQHADAQKEARPNTGLPLFASIRSLLSPAYITQSLLLWGAFFFLLISLYFALSWLPKLMVDHGYSQAGGITAGLLLNVFGIVGIISVGLLTIKWRPDYVAVAFLCAASAMFFSCAAFIEVRALAFVVIGLLGFTLIGSMIALYALTPTLYPAAFRSTGTGWAIGLSRFGAVIGPAAAGAMFAANWQLSWIFYCFAAPVFIAAIAVFLIARVARSEIGRRKLNSEMSK